MSEISNEKQIIFFGDSLFAGYGLSSPDKDAIPALIAAKLKEAGLAYHVVNAGLSGDTTSAAIQRLPEYLNERISLIILELGANDFIRGTAPGRIAFNLEQIIRLIRQFDPSVSIILAGLALPSWVSSSFTSCYADLYQAVADRTGVMLIPDFLKGVAGKSQYNLPDGVHPLASGYLIAADNIWPYIQNLVEDPDTL